VGCGVKLCDPLLTHAIPERLTAELLIMIKRCTNALYFTSVHRSFQRVKIALKSMQKSHRTVSLSLKIAQRC